MADDTAPAPTPAEPSNFKVAVGAAKTWLTTDGPIEFTKKMVWFLALAMVAGIALGYFAMNAWSKRQEIRLKHEQVQTLKQNARDSAKAIADAHLKDQEIERRVQQGNEVADLNRADALARVNAQLERRNDELEQQLQALRLDAASREALAALCADPRLDAGTVRMLNDARRGSVDAAGQRDAAGKAAAATAGPRAGR